MSAFSEALADYMPDKAPTYPKVSVILERLSDDDRQDFLEACLDPDIPMNHIRRAVMRTSGAEISDRQFARFVRDFREWVSTTT